MSPLSIVDDLEAEESALEELVTALEVSAWDAPTPAEGYLVRDQIHHLGLGEELAALAIADSAGFQSRRAELLTDIEEIEKRAAIRARELTPAELLAYWGQNRQATLAALRDLPDGARIPWIVGDMGIKSFATARLMETWAHGQDVVDALALDRQPTDRLRHIADLGVRTRDFAYRIRSMEPPTTEFRLDLVLPSGEPWTSGPPDVEDRITGPAADFCLVVTQRRHRDDTRLRVSGDRAVEWMAIAQAFAGPPTEGQPRHGSS